MFELLSSDEPMLHELYGLWGECNDISNTFRSWLDKIASIRDTLKLGNKARNVKSLMPFSTHPFPFEPLGCELINNYKELPFGVTENTVMKDLFQIYDTMLSLQYLEGKTPQIPLKDDKIDSESQECHKTLDKRVFESTNAMLSSRSRNCAAFYLMMNNLIKYPFRKLSVSESLGCDTFSLDTLSKLRYTNLIVWHRNTQALLFGSKPIIDPENFGKQHGEEVITWRDLLHFEFLVTCFEFVILAIVRENEFSLRK